jgi:hypothetical protein
MHKNAMKCNETLSKWCKNKHGASKIMDTLETYYHLKNYYFCYHLPTRGRAKVKLGDADMLQRIYNF